MTIDVVESVNLSATPALVHTHTEHARIAKDIARV